MRSEANIVVANLDDPEHQRAIVTLTAAYALDAMGNGAPLTAEVLDRLIPGLREHPTAIIFLAYVDGKAAGIATCFLGFSTFAARPLINIHDLAVLPEYRGQGLGRALLDAVERNARLRRCCKVTLEVQENNHRARRVYKAAGFAQAVYNDRTGGGAVLCEGTLVRAGATSETRSLDQPQRSNLHIAAGDFFAQAGEPVGEAAG
jgi:GNAT superfamily N-acetyltransferase